MAYEEDYELFKRAWSVTAAATAIIPYALPILGLMSLVLADPGEQDRAGDQWNDKTPVNISQNDQKGWHPPMAAGAKPAQQTWNVPMTASSSQASDLSYLRGELKRLVKEIGDAGEWAGQGYSSFTQKVLELDGQLEKLDNTRVACGDTLKCSAAAYHFLAQLCMIVSTLMGTLAAFVAITYATPANVQAQVTAIKTVQSVYKSMLASFKSHWKLVAKVTVYMGLAATAYSQFTKDLPFLKAMPSTGTPNLVDASVIWDPSKADMVKNPTPQMPNVDDGMIPEFGF
ncbi:hypothetical protein [Nonomuraea sp. JJY05]|uniref:hypothetical protein n=1 Tax=Nonomuraea sp. JJY05 TaxID=3350255 RepID=UPI00373E55CF